MEKLTWSDVRDDVHAANSELAMLIDEIDPGPEYSLYRAKYAYGDTILKNGILHVPLTKGGVVPVAGNHVSTEVLNDLSSFLSIPPGIVLNNNIEFFLQNTDRPIPVALHKRGSTIGLWSSENLGDSHWHMSNIWHITAGSRALFMLPKITDTASYLRLRKEFSLRSYVPSDLSNQWSLFLELANHPEFSQPWHVDLLLFSRKWIEKTTDPAWDKFWFKIIKRYWAKTDFSRNHWLFDYFFSCMQQKHNLKPNPYLADTVKHVFAIGAGTSPGLSVATDNTSAPIQGLQKIFTEVYGLKSYAPIMLHTNYCDVTQPDQAVYYSLQLPTTTEFAPKSRQVISNMVGLQEIKYLMGKFIKDVLSSNMLSAKDSCHYFANHLDFHYVHADEDPRREIAHSSSLLQYDPQLAAELARWPGRTFSENAPFWKGCVLISEKKA
jgi:hypothetical protein